MAGNSKIVKTGGGSKGVRINPIYLSIAGLELGDNIIIEAKKDKITIKKV